MNPTTVFEFERDTNDVYDMAYDYLVNIYNEDDLPSDKVDEVIRELQRRMSSQVNDYKMPAFQVWFYRKMPDLYDEVSNIVSSAIDEYIAYTAKEVIDGMKE